MVSLLIATTSAGLTRQTSASQSATGQTDTAPTATSVQVDPQVSRLISILNGKDIAARTQALRQLVSLGQSAQPAVPTLEAILGSQAPAETKLLRVRVARTLGQLGRVAAHAVGPLLEATQNQNQEIRRESVIAIGAILAGTADPMLGTVAKGLVTSVEKHDDLSDVTRRTLLSLGPNIASFLIDTTRPSHKEISRLLSANVLADSDYLTVALAANLIDLVNDTQVELRPLAADAIAGAVRRCALGGKLCVQELPTIERLAVSLTDPTLSKYRSSLDLAIRYLSDLRDAKELTKFETWLQGNAVYLLATSIIGIVSSLATFAVAWVRRRKISESTNKINQLNAEIDSISGQKAAIVQNQIAQAVLKRFVTMPVDEKRPGFQIAAAFGNSSDVSGDFYNWFSRIDGSVCIYLVDVEGSGIDAAIQATHAAKVLERTLTRGDVQPPEVLLATADRVMHEELRQPNIAVTMNLIEVYPDRVRLANAGMPAPLLFRYGQAQPQQLQAAGVYVGAGYSRFPVQPRFDETSVGQGDLLILFSDGVLEASSKYSIFGRTGIESAVARVHDQPPDVIARAILGAAAAFIGNQPPQDDQTVVVVRFGRHTPILAGARTLDVIHSDVVEAEFNLVNAADTPEVCASDLQELVRSWLRPIPEDLAGKIWCAVWELVMNAVTHGSAGGEVISLKTKKTNDTIVIAVEQPKEWRDWDNRLGSTRKASLSPGAPQNEGDLGGTATILKLSDVVTASMQGRLLTVVFNKVPNNT